MVSFPDAGTDPGSSSAWSNETIVQHGTARERIELLALRAVVALLGRVSQERSIAIGAAIGALFGEGARRLSARIHRVAAMNLEIAFPSRPAFERDAIRRAMWCNWGRMLAEVARLACLAPAELCDLVYLDPPDGAAEIFRRAEEGGSIVLTAHFGSFELLHAACAVHGFPISLVHRTLPNRRADRWLTALRERFGSRVLRRGVAAREILRELRDGHVVALPFDQRPPSASAIYSPFFSLSPTTNSGVARIALAARAPVFPVFLVREGNSARHRAVFGPEIEVVRTGNREADVIENTRRFNAALEQMIRSQPDHWIWMYRRWKRLPGGLGSPYRSDAPPLAEYRRVAHEASELNEPSALSEPATTRFRAPDDAEGAEVAEVPDGNAPPAESAKATGRSA